ncbi:MAG TPA: hypothetical protein VE008_08480 [Burkholderiales bacterium]|nr:hypothetical protein [Burkholderiales bacterium]
MGVQVEDSSKSRALGLFLAVGLLSSCGPSGMNSSLDSTPPAPPPPPVATFTVHPKYFIGSVIYMPPGQGSTMIYGFGTMLGTTISTTSSWSKGSLVATQTGLPLPLDPPFSFGNAFGGATTQSVDLQVSWANLSISWSPPGSDSINHDYDLILVYLGVDVNAAVDALGNVSWGMDFSQVPFRGFSDVGYFITVGCLRANSTIPASGCAGEVHLLDSVGLTPDDYPGLLGADPFADPGVSPTPDPARFVHLGEFPYAFSGSSPATALLTNSANAGNSQIASYGYTVSATTSASYDGVSLVDPTKFTWSNTSTLSNLTGSSPKSLKLVLAQPSASYAGPLMLHAYLDTIYKTVMYSFVTPSH